MTSPPPHDAAAPDLICLAYLSSATKPFDRAELEALAKAAAENNAKRAITGMLCYFDGSFLQFLEGPPAAIEATLTAIKGDPRHGGLLPVYREAIGERVFGEWSMAVTHPDQLSGDQRRLFTNLRSFDWSTSAASPHRGDLELFLATFRSWMR